MATEEQTSYNATYGMNSPDRFGQRLTISSRSVSKLGFWLSKNKTTAFTAILTFTIRSVSDDSILASKVWGDGYNLAYLSAAYKEVTFDAPVSLNEEVRILVESDGTNPTRYARIHIQNTDVKASEVLTRYTTSTWSDTPTTSDAAYIYTYVSLGSAPAVTCGACTNTSGNNTVGNGYIQNLGDSAVTQHGHCWDTSANPTTTDSASGEWGKTTNGMANQTGSFPSLVTGLTAGTLYYMAAYATNTGGTTYSTPDIEVTTLTYIGGTETAGILKVYNEELRYGSATGILRGGTFGSVDKQADETILAWLGL